MPKRSKTRSNVKRNELSSQIKLLLTPSPSIAALLMARDVLNASVTTFVVLKEITPNICSLLSLKDLLSWCQVCKETRKWRSCVVRNQITTLLRLFIPVPHDLLDVMRQTNSIISGSSILWLLNGFPESWSPGDLEVYCLPGEGPKLVEFFQNQGYSVMDSLYSSDGEENDDDDEKEESYFLDNVMLSSTTMMKNGDLKVAIQETVEDSALDSVGWYHSTVVMNYISWNEIAVLYPSLTLRKLDIVQDETKQRGDTWLEKYKGLSYVICYPSRVPDGFLEHCPGILRTNQDKHSLLIQFDDKLPTGSPLLIGNSGSLTHQPLTSPPQINAPKPFYLHVY